MKMHIPVAMQRSLELRFALFYEDVLENRNPKSPQMPGKSTTTSPITVAKTTSTTTTASGQQTRKIKWNGFRVSPSTTTTYRLHCLCLPLLVVVQRTRDHDYH